MKDRSRWTRQAEHVDHRWWSLLFAFTTACGAGTPPAAAPEPADDAEEESYRGLEEQGAPATEREAAPAGAPPPSSMDRAPQAADEFESFDALYGSLEDALSLAAPDCNVAIPLRDQICDLSKRICALSDEQRHDSFLAERCGDARARCQRATDRVRAVCP